MRLSLILAITLGLAQAPKPVPLNTIVDGVNRTYARMTDFSADFVQVEQNSLNRKEQAAGHVSLKRPRMARFDYKVPEEKLFVSNGKKVTFYIPADKQANVSKVQDSMDERLPLLFLVGRSNLRGEFKGFEQPPVKPVVEGTTVVRMMPNKKMELTELLMEVDPKTFLIRRLVMVQGDGSRREWTFSNIKVDTGLKNSFFDFKPPAGVQVVLEGIRQ